MNAKSLFRPLGATAAAALAFGLCVATPAHADDELIVRAPYTVQRHVNRVGGNAGEETITVRKYVSTAGLNLRYRGDIDALYARIDYAARDVCRRAMLVTPISYSESGTSERECYQDAYRGAKRQADRLVRSYYY